MPKTQSIVGGESYRARVLRDNPVAYYRLDDLEGYAQAVLSDGPLGFWRLNGNANDSAASPHNGAVSGTVTFGQTAPLADGSTAALFDGTTGVVKATGVATIGGAAACTLEGWINLNGVTPAAGQHIFFSIGNIGHYLQLQASTPSVSLRIATVQQFVNAPSGVATSGWHHIMATWASGNFIRLYVDGVQVSTSATVLSGTLDGASGFSIGAFDPTTPSLFFGGSIADCAVYNYALSAQEVANHYALRTSTVATVAAATVADLSGNARIGTVAGGVALQQTGALADGNQAAKFDGASTTVVNTFSDGATIVPTTAWSLEAWFKQNGTAGGSLITRANTRPSLYMNGGAATLSVTDGSSVLVSIFYGVSLFDALWHHVVGTYDGTSLRIYVDGVLRAGPTACNAYAVLGSQVWRIGGRSDGVLPLDGYTDEVAIYAYTLTAEQVAAHYFNRLAVTSGLRAGGAAPTARKRATVGSGGIRVTGAATLRRGRVLTGSGGVRVGGIAPTVNTIAHGTRATERVVDVPFENRTIVVPFENRVITVPAEA